MGDGIGSDLGNFRCEREVAVDDVGSADRFQIVGVLQRRSCNNGREPGCFRKLESYKAAAIRLILFRYGEGVTH